MKTIRVFRIWKNWGLISRLMLAVGVAIIAGGGVQTALLLAEGAVEHSAACCGSRRKRSPSSRHWSPIRRWLAITRRSANC